MSIDPGDTLLGFRQYKAARLRTDELPGLEIEFAERVSVFSTGRKTSEAKTIPRIETPQTVLDPLFVVRFGQGVVVEDGLPFGLWTEIVGERGLTHDAANMICILPRVIDRSLAKIGDCQPVRRLKHFERLGAELGKSRVCFENLGGALVLGLHPLHRPRAVDVFQPLVVVRLLRRCRTHGGTGGRIGGRLCKADRRRQRDGKQHMSSESKNAIRMHGGAAS